MLGAEKQHHDTRDSLKIGESLSTVRQVWERMNERAVNECTDERVFESHCAALKLSYDLTND